MQFIHLLLKASSCCLNFFPLADAGVKTLSNFISNLASTIFNLSFSLLDQMMKNFSANIFSTLIYKVFQDSFFHKTNWKHILEGLKLLIQFNWMWKWEEEVWCWWRGCQRQTKTCWVSWSEHWEHKWHDSAQEQSSSYGTGFRDRAKVQSSNILKCFTTISISSANWWLIVLR